MRISGLLHSLVLHRALSSLNDPYDWKHFGEGQIGHLYNFALAYPNLIVIFLIFSFLCLTGLTPVIVLTKVDLPCATWPIVPIF